METVKIDEIDLKILGLLQANGRLSKSKIAQSVHLSEVPCWRRVRHLEQAGVISSYVALINQTMLGYTFSAMAQLKFGFESEDGHRAMRDVVARLPEVLGLYSTIGDYDYVLFMVTRDVQGFRQFVEQQLRALPGVTRITTTVVLDTIKSDARVNLQCTDKPP